MALVFGVLTLTLLANQVATGLALTIFGIGLSRRCSARASSASPVAAAAQAPYPGPQRPAGARPALFGHDVLVYLSVAADRRRSPGSSSARAPA